MLKKLFVLVIFCTLSLQACGDVNDTLLSNEVGIMNNTESSFSVDYVEDWPVYRSFLGSGVITDTLEKNEWCTIVNVLSVLNNGKRAQDRGGIWYGMPDDWTVKIQVIRDSNTLIPQVVGSYVDGGETLVLNRYGDLPKNINGIPHNDYWFGTHITLLSGNVFERNIFVLGMNMVSNSGFRDRVAYEIVHSYGLSKLDEDNLFNLAKRAKAGCHRPRSGSKPQPQGSTSNNGGSTSNGGPSGGGGSGGGPAGGGGTNGSSGGGPVGGGGSA